MGVTAGSASPCNATEDGLERARRNPGAWLERPVESGTAAGFGVYLHVPFCSHRCGYCDFATDAVGVDGDEALFDRYVQALQLAIRSSVAAGPAAHAPPGALPADTAWPRVTSVFVGGGTPSLVGGQRLARLVATLRDQLDVEADAEITVECNPESSTPRLFAALAAAGVNRVSLGAQSFVPRVLRTLERGHDPGRVATVVAHARQAGLGHVGIDLIYGTPGEDDADWRRSLELALATGVDHVSAYALTIHDNTPFGRSVAAGALPDVDDDVQRERFEVARQVLGDAGMDQYELANWAYSAASRSRHNVLYWRHGDYLGVGVGAHGHVAGRRWWATRATARWMAAVEQGSSGVAGDEILTPSERAVERLMLGMRLRDGIHPYDLPPIEPMALESALARGLVEFSCGRLRASDDGMFLLDETVRTLA